MWRNKNKNTLDIEKPIIDPDSLCKIKQFRHEMMMVLDNCKQSLQQIIDDYATIEEPTYHEMQLYATAKVFLKMPIYKQNIYLASQFIFRTITEFADYLQVSRPTLTKFLKSIKTEVHKHALYTIKHLNS